MLKYQENIIERGRVSSEREYRKLFKDIVSSRISTENGDETFWGIVLDDEHFVFCNNILRFLGHGVVGRVGIHNNGKMLDKKTVEFFISKDRKES